MAELLTDTLISPHYAVDDHTASHKKTPKEVTDIMDWIQCFGMYIAVVSLKEPHRIPDLIGYQNLIVQSSIDSHEGRWIIYDRHFRLKASATTIQEWSAIDITVWRMAFPEQLSITQPQDHRCTSHLHSPSVAVHPLSQRHVSAWNGMRALVQDALDLPVGLSTFVIQYSSKAKSRFPYVPRNRDARRLGKAFSLE